MSKTIKVPLDDDQFGRAIKILSEWEDDDKRYGLIDTSEEDLTDEEKEKGVVKIIVTGSITYDLWKEFCEEVGITIPFPNF